MPSAEKTRAIVDWPMPTSQKEVRSFLGLANFYRRFIPQFLSIAAPLNDLTSSKATFRWTDQHQAAFSKFKDALSSLPILDHPKRSDTFVLTTDAPEHGVGAVLSTSRGTVVEYASRSLTAAENKYCTIEQECLAIVWATRKLRHYLIGAQFTLETDHNLLNGWNQLGRAMHKHKDLSAALWSFGLLNLMMCTALGNLTSMQMPSLDFLWQ